jgi:hypothetical protein
MKQVGLWITIIIISLLIGACRKTEDVKITATSVHESYGPEGLLKAAEPGWHARRTPVYPQTVTFAFVNPQQISQVGFLPQSDHVNRFPKNVAVEISEDADTWRSLFGLETWKEVAAVENDCKAPAEIWREHRLGSAVRTGNIRLTILSNCGDPDLLTLRGVRFT